MSEHAHRVASRFPPSSIEHGVALYHDHIEDAIGPVPHDIIDIVLTLTRRHGETYPDYITRISNSGDPVAIAVKLADLEDNLERCRGLHGGNSKSGLELRYRQAHALLSLHAPHWATVAKPAPENPPETNDCTHLRQTITDVLDAEIGDDAVALRQMLLVALNEPGPGTGTAVRLGSPQGQSHGPDATPGSLKASWETCPSCGGDAGDNTFDRSLCPCTPNGRMHTRCAQCGYSLDGCDFEDPDTRPRIAADALQEANRTLARSLHHVQAERAKAEARVQALEAQLAEDLRPVTYGDRLAVAEIAGDALDQFPNDPKLYQLIDAVRCCAEFPECSHVLAWVDAHDAAREQEGRNDG